MRGFIVFEVKFGGLRWDERLLGKGSLLHTWRAGRLHAKAQAPESANFFEA
jgi:hypothetical protein